MESKFAFSVLDYLNWMRDVDEIRGDSDLSRQSQETIKRLEKISEEAQKTSGFDCSETRKFLFDSYKDENLKYQLKQLFRHYEFFFHPKEISQKNKKGLMEKIINEYI